MRSCEVGSLAASFLGRALLLAMLGPATLWSETTFGPTDASWSLDLGVSGASLMILRIGVSATSTDAFDSGIDTIAPVDPAVPGVVLLVGAAGEGLFGDYRGQASQMSWIGAVSPSVDATHLTWDSSVIPAWLTVQLSPVSWDGNGWIPSGPVLAMESTAETVFPADTATQYFSIVANSHLAPALQLPEGQVTRELAPLSFVAVASDDDTPTDQLVYSLSSAPAGASIDPSSGAFTWTPSEGQGPGTFDVVIKVSDGANATEGSVRVDVNEVNTAPVLAASADRSADELTTIQFRVSGTDGDLPAQNLSYALVDAPAGASIDPSTGDFSWTPTEAQGPGHYPMSVVVSDGSLSDTRVINLDVAEVNTPPVLEAVPARNVPRLYPYQIVLKASDPDLPAQTLTYSLANAPAGMTVDPASGVVTWIASLGETLGEHRISASVSDGTAAVARELRIILDEALAEAWIEARLSDARFDGLRGPFEDPDHDGLPSLVEYATGLDPAVADAHELFRYSRAAAGAALRFSMRCRSDDPALRQVLRLALGPDYAGWTAVDVLFSYDAASGRFVWTADSPDLELIDQVEVEAGFYELHFQLNPVNDGVLLQMQVVR